MRARRQAIIAVNAGSSSLKFALYPYLADGGTGAATLSGGIDGLEPGGQPGLTLQAAGASSRQALPITPIDSFEQALTTLRKVLAQHAGDIEVVAIAHRIVHGGEAFPQSVLLDAEAMARLRALAPLAPLHQPHNLDGVEAFQRAYPGLPQVGCFDTSFHASMGPLEQTFALPRALRQDGIRRYGFHGLSYRYVAARLAEHSERAGARVLMAHLGNGASVCAMRDGASSATSMGFSALDGLMMGTRSGALDPGVLLHLLRLGWDRARIEAMLYKQSGLLGVSGVSADMRTLRASEQPAAAFAIELFVHRLVRECGALTATLGGIDLLAFTGGIGEHDAALRQATCEQLAFLGLRIDPARNREADGSRIMAIHAPSSSVEIWVVPTDEGRVAAGDAAALLAAAR
ncbi:acetate/propionate family kinase [Rugamonas sp. CCM 8940]|nr:acetate/propionate family kinase [Rugamonas sp. CCM 8940]